MRKSSKAISLLLSGLMATSCFSMAAVTATAATVDSEATGVMTEAERLAAGHELVYFKFPEKIWGDVNNVKWSPKKHTVNVYCNFYAIYGNKKDVKSRAWEAPSTSMMADSNGCDTFYFDITEGKQIAEKDANDDHKMEPGAAYGILFSTKANADSPNTLKPNTDGYQTCDMYFDTNCIGDTFVVDTPAKVRENTANSQKIDYYGHSLNGISKPIRKVSTLCAYIDGMGKELDGKTKVGNNTLNYVPDSLELANRLKDYLPNPTNEPSFSQRKVAEMMPYFETNAVDVYWMYDERFGEDYAKGTQYTHVDGVEDQKADGSLKDCYRYRSLEKDAGTAEAKTIYYPDYTLVAERLGLIEPGSVKETVPKDGIIPKQVKTVDLTLSGDEITMPADANYAVEAVKKDGKLVVTISSKSGYAFTAKPEVSLTGFPEETTTAYDNGKTYIDAVDGKVIVTAHKPVEELIGDVALNVSEEDLAAGKPAPTVENGANYTATLTLAPADSTLAYSTDYTLTATYTANDGYYFDDTTTVTTGLDSYAKSVSKKTLVVTRTFKTEDEPVPEPTLINKATLDFSNALINYGEAVPTPVVPAGENYTVTAAWDPDDSTFAAGTYTLTATLTANEGYAFAADGSLELANILEGSAPYTVVSQALVDGKMEVKLGFDIPEPPAPVDTYVVAGDTADFFGTTWDGASAENAMTKNEDGTYSKTYTAEKAYLAVQLKVVKNGAEWIGDKDGNNIGFALSDAGDFTVTFNPETQEITVTGANVGPIAFPENPDIYAAGNGEGSWLNGVNWQPNDERNKMTQVNDKVWEIKFEDVPEGFDRQIKFAVNGAWTFNFGASKAEDAPAFEPGVAMEAGWDGGNITFDTEDTCNITARLDLTNFDFDTKTGATYTITIEEPTPSPIFGDVDGDGEVTINDATLIQRRGIELEVFTAEQDLLADVNRDGRVSILDVTCISRYLAEMTEGTGWTGLRLKDVVNAD